MGIFVNSDNSAFQVALNSEIYIDKTGLLTYTNKVMNTLQKWEQGESSPTPYIIKLIANQLPIDNDNMCKIEDNNGKIYYYNRDAGYLIDSIGTKIKIGEDLDGVKEKNLSLYVADLLESYYEIVDKFNRDCRLDKTEDIIWS